jgi:putative transposase
MPYDPAIHRGRLIRLPPEFYRGRAFVHWSMAMEQRATGWLNSLHHAKLREILCHVLARNQLVCPAYCIMPDHGHFLWLGIHELSDQRIAASRFRRAWNIELGRVGVALQRQAFDHVLSKAEREHGALPAVAHYIFENPARAKLHVAGIQYPFSGAMVPGYPDVDPFAGDFWERFWRIYNYLV